MDIGVHLAAVKELLPKVHTSDPQRVVSATYLDNIAPVAKNVIFHDMGYQSQFFSEVNCVGTQKYNRAVFGI